MAEGKSIRLDSLESALNIAGAYENELEVLILMKRVCDESDDVRSLERHLDETRSFHQKIRTSRIGTQEWNNFCKMELILKGSMRNAWIRFRKFSISWKVIGNENRKPYTTASDCG